MRFVRGLGEALAVQHRVVAMVSVGDLTRPSACAGWTIDQVLRHSLGVTRKFTAFAAGETDAPRTPARDSLGDHPDLAIREAAQRSALAWRNSDLNRVCVLPFAQVDGHLAAGINLYDVVAHSWDIAQPLGLSVPCNDGLWQLALDAARAALAIARDPDHFAPPLAVDRDAPPQAQFLALLGRQVR